LPLPRAAGSNALDSQHAHETDFWHSFSLRHIDLCIGSSRSHTARIDELTALKGKMNEKEGVYKVTFPRDDVKVVVDGWMMPPFMGLGTWAAFTKGAHTEAMVMGDTVLFEDEVNAAMSSALDNGLSVTALHNHFSSINPRSISCTSKAKAALINWRAQLKSLRHDQSNPRPKRETGRVVFGRWATIVARKKFD